VSKLALVDWLLGPEAEASTFMFAPSDILLSQDFCLFSAKFFQKLKWFAPILSPLLSAKLERGRPAYPPTFV
jgi:hypothetical protein